MFNELDRVIHTTHLSRGTVLEVEGDIAYIELDNGVEMEYLVSDLVLESEHKSPEEQMQDEIEADKAEKLAIAKLILPEVRSLIVAMSQHTAERAAMALALLGGSATPWEKLTAYHKMNFISVATNTSFETWVEAYNEKRLANLQLTIMANIGREAMGGS